MWDLGLELPWLLPRVDILISEEQLNFVIGTVV